MSTGALPADLSAWITSTTSGAVIKADRHLSGASRQAWSVDIERDGRTIPLFVLRDALSGNGGSVRDGTVLLALAQSPIPVPKVYAVDEHLGAIILERVEGVSELQGADDDAVAPHLMRLAAALHGLDPATLPIAHLGLPGDPAGHAAAQLANADQVAAMLGEGIAPLFSFALAWLRRSVPTDGARTSLVHSDLGPGNFVHHGGRITALLDWEVAHWGDAMEDLAAISVRDMATPIGHLPTLYKEYEAANGGPVDLARVRWYRVLVLTRNSMLITLGLGRDDALLDRAQLTMFRMLLMRAGALALCDAIGIERPLEPPLAPSVEDDDLRLIAHAWRDQRDVVLPALHDPYAGGRAQGVGAIVGYFDHRMRFGADYVRRELDALAELLGRRPASEADGYTEVRGLCDAAGRERELARFFAAHLLRRGMLCAPLLGALAERLPQRLEDP
jgi:aminoglycoside phosphotransferase (APT) family kinase protein